MRGAILRRFLAEGREEVAGTKRTIEAWFFALEREFKPMIQGDRVFGSIRFRSKAASGLTENDAGQKPDGRERLQDASRLTGQPARHFLVGLVGFAVKA